MRACESTWPLFQISFRNALALGVVAVFALPSLLAAVAVLGFVALEVFLAVA